MFCSAKTDEGNDGSVSSLSGHLAYICMLPQGSSHQIHAAHFSIQ